MRFNLSRSIGLPPQCTTVIILVCWFIVGWFLLWGVGVVVLRHENGLLVIRVAQANIW